MDVQIQNMVSAQIDLTEKENKVVELKKALDSHSSKEKAIKQIIRDYADQNPQYNPENK